MRNNKKISFLFRVSLVFLFCVCFAAALGANAAIHGPNECCTLDHALTDIDAACTKGTIVAADGCDKMPYATGPGPNGENCRCVGAPLECECDLEPAPVDGIYESTCEDAGLKCWCDADDDGINNAPFNSPFGCVNTATITKNWGTCCIVDAIYNVTDWIFYVLLAAIAIIFILAGFLFFAAGGDPQKVRQAQNFLLYGIIGLALALFARIIPAIIKGIVS